MTTENKHPRGVILQTARTLLCIGNPNAPVGESDEEMEIGDVMVVSVGRQWVCDGLEVVEAMAAGCGASWAWRAATIGKPTSIEFKRISLIGFHSCTSRSRYRSVSKQTTRHLPQSCLMLTLEGFPFITVNTKEYHSECSGNYHKDNA
ncbi:hypothetical protein Tco_0204713 [Tanacetum coccineum]